MIPMRKSLILFILITFAGSSIAKIGIGDPAPDFTLEDVITGEQVHLSTFKEQIVVLRIWRVCKGKCRANVPVLNRIYEEFSLRSPDDKSQVKVLSVNAIDSKRRILVETEKMEVKYQVLIGRQSGIASDYGAIALPQIFVINRDGIICFNAMYPKYEELKDVISKLINGE